MSSQKTPEISPLFKCDSATLSFYASKDGKISVSFSGWDARRRGMAYERAGSSGNFHVTFLGPEAEHAVPQEQQAASSSTASMLIRASAQGPPRLKGTFRLHPRSRTGLRGWVSFSGWDARRRGMAYERAGSSGNFHVTFLGPEAEHAVPQEQQAASSSTASMLIRASAQGPPRLKGTFRLHPRSRTGLRGWARPGPRPQLQLRGWSYGADDVGRGTRSRAPAAPRLAR